MASSQREYWLANKHIIISGAGISGLSFAIALHKLWPTICSSPAPQLTLYERDPSAVPAGREGFSLSLRSDHPSAGIQTLQKLGMLDKLLAVSIAELGKGQEKKGEEGGFVVWNIKSDDWKPVIKVRSKTPKGLPVSGMRINRGELRRTLVEAVEALPNVTIHWNTTITGVHTAPDGGLEVEIKDGQTVKGDILIAADGNSSKIRTLLRPRDRLEFAGPTCIFGTAPISTHPSAPNTRSREFGSVISGQGPALFVAPIDQKSLVWSLSWHKENPPIPKKQPLTPSEISEILDEAREKGSVFGKRFEQMIKSTAEGSIARFNAQDKLSFAHKDYISSPQYADLNGRVVFLGDANHAVSPFAGNGANLALMDGWDFAESLVRSGDLNEAIEKYDKLAVGRARKVVGISHFTIKVMHSQGIRFWLYMVVLKVMLIVMKTLKIL